MINKKNSNEANLKSVVSTLPNRPGIYQYLNEKGKVIYVGKAKNLKKRVNSYFNKNHEPGKTRILVRQIRDIKYFIVNSEEDALLLENNLIKKYQPRYNVLLKDDKTYPSICVKNEYFPRVFSTRKIVRDGSTYYGPYSHLPTMKGLLKLMKKLYPIRSCNYNLTPENIAERKFKVCLQYHIKNCLGPCVGKQSHKEYMEDIKEINEILKGNTREISQLLVEKMISYAKKLKFEEAENIKQKYLLVENFRSKSEVVSNKLHNVDVFSIAENENNSAFINYLHVVNGAIIRAFTFEYKKRLDEPPKELLRLGIIEVRERYKSKSPEIIVPFEIDLELDGVILSIPQRGDKKKLLDLSLLNVQQYKADRLKQAEKLNPEQRSIRQLKAIQKQLQLKKTPMHIECFDNSNIQGSDPVAACVVFRKGRPSKKEYRKYHIKTVKGPNDYASMEEVINRRYSRLKKNNESLPDLILTDGGKGQMSAVKKTLDLLNLSIPVAGLAKDEKHHTSELLFGDPPKVIGIKQNTPLFRLLEQIQNEVHRFAIRFHRDMRSKRQITSELDNIPGIGPITKNKLLKKYKSVKRIKEAPEEEIKELIGPAKAKAIIAGLN